MSLLGDRLGVEQPKKPSPKELALMNEGQLNALSKTHGWSIEELLAEAQQGWKELGSEYDTEHDQGKNQHWQ